MRKPEIETSIGQYLDLVKWDAAERATIQVLLRRKLKTCFGKTGERVWKRFIRSSIHDNVSRQHVITNEHDWMLHSYTLKAGNTARTSSSWGSISGSGPTGVICYRMPRSEKSAFSRRGDYWLTLQQQNLTYVRVDLRVAFCIVLLNVFELGSLFEGSNFPVKKSQPFM